MSWQKNLSDNQVVQAQSHVLLMASLSLYVTQGLASTCRGVTLRNSVRQILEN
jgi:hypothetical protein